MSFYYCENKGKMTKIYETNEICKIVADTLNYYCDKMEEERVRGDRTMAEAEQLVRDYRDKELNEMEERLARTYIEFSSKKEKEEYLEFKKEHENCSDYSPMIKVDGCALGLIYYIKCAGCGAEKSIADTESW